MNIFVTDENPIIAACNLCDSHIVKMTLESAQLICTALIHSGIPSIPTSDNQWQPNTIGYRQTHINHPCSKWARASSSNLNWLWTHFDEQCAEYTRRYNKIHLVETKMKQIRKFKPQDDFKNHTPFAQAMPEQYKCNDAIEAYRNYYFSEKRRFAVWKRLNNTPDWWQERKKSSYDVTHATKQTI